MSINGLHQKEIQYFFYSSKSHLLQTEKLDFPSRYFPVMIVTTLFMTVDIAN